MNDLIFAAYGAASDEQLWPYLLDEVMARTGASGGLFIALDERNAPLLLSLKGASTSEQQAYQDHFMQRDIVLQHFKRADLKGEGWIGALHELLPKDQLLRSEYYNDFMRPMDHFHQIGANLGLFANISFGGMSLLRSRVPGPFDESALSLLRELAPHIRQSLTLRHQLLSMEQSCAFLDQATEAHQIAAFNVSKSGQVLHMTAAAERLLRIADGLQVRSGYLRSDDAGETALLHGHIRSAVHTMTRKSPEAILSKTSGYAIPISRKPPKPPLNVTVYPFIPNKLLPGNNGSTLVFAVDSSSRLPSRAIVLANLFGLTPSEGRFADVYMQSLSIRSTAELLRLTENSGRAAMKSIFRKTGARSQAALVRLLTAIPSHDSD